MSLLLKAQDYDKTKQILAKASIFFAIYFFCSYCKKSFNKIFLMHQKQDQCFLGVNSPPIFLIFNKKTEADLAFTTRSSSLQSLCTQVYNTVLQTLPCFNLGSEYVILLDSLNRRRSFLKYIR